MEVYNRQVLRARLLQHRGMLDNVWRAAPTFLVWFFTCGKVHQLLWPGDAFGAMSHSESGAVIFPPHWQTWEPNDESAALQQTTHPRMWQRGKKEKRTRTNAWGSLWWSKPTLTWGSEGALCSPGVILSSPLFARVWMAASLHWHLKNFTSPRSHKPVCVRMELRRL